MKRTLIAGLLLVSSTVVNAQPVWVYSNAAENAYVNLPIEYIGITAHPINLWNFKTPRVITGWQYKARSLATASVINCSTGSVRVKYAYASVSHWFNGPYARLNWIQLYDGKRVYPGYWYGFGYFPLQIRQMIVDICGA